MSHFVAVVIGDNPEAQLAPYHEFECTGRNDEFVKDIDNTEAARNDWLAHKEVRLKLKDGTLVAFFDDKGKWVPEYSQPVPDSRLSGIRGERTYFVPEGCEKVEVQGAAAMSFAEYCRDRRGHEIVRPGETPDIAGEHKFGYVLVDEAGEVIKDVDRTNCAKWLWSDANGQEIAISFGDALLPGVQKDPDCRGQFLLDDTGRLVHLLQGLHACEQQGATVYDATAEMAPESSVRANACAVSNDAGTTAACVCGMQETAGTAHRRICSGSCTRFRRCSSPVMPHLQPAAWVCEGQPVYLKGSSRVSGPLRRIFIGGSKWDWYRVGGRWSGFFDLKPGKTGELGTPGVFDNVARPDTADVLTLGDIDFEKMRDTAAADAAEAWDRVRGAAGDMTSFNTWAETREACIAEFGETREAMCEARSRYHGQDQIKRCEAAKVIDGWQASLDDYIVDRDTFITRARNRAGVPFAVVKDSKWYERGSMGWWGMVSNEEDMDTWVTKFWELMDGLPDDTIITVVDCHI